MSSPDFLILYEHIVRELDADCLLKAELERRGYTCELMQLMAPRKLSYFINKPKVIVTSAMYDNKTLNSFVYNVVGKLDKVVNLHWEEVLSREQEESTFYSLTENAAKCTHICWGEAARQRIIGNGVPADNAVVTGAVQLDFLLPQFDRFYRTREQLADEFGLDTGKRWLCYVSSFSCANMDDKEVAELNDMTSLDFDGFRAVGKRSMDITLDWFDKYLTKHPDEILIYRPHPSEWQSPPLREMSDKHPNFRVISDYSVKQWVKACDLIVTWMSTSIAEIYYAGSPCVVVRPEPLHDDYDPVVYEGVRACDSYEMMESELENPPEEFPVNEDLIRLHYDFIEGRPAYVRIADLLEWTLKNPPRDLPFSEGYKPHFNFVKFISFIGLNLMVSMKIDPYKFRILPKSFLDTTSRMLGYISKARVSKEDINALTARIRGLIDG